jgi:DnaJ family protein A protein 2
MAKDYYETLGVSKDVDKQALKKAYHKLAMQYHPDRNKEPGADEKFKEISNAYSVLSNDDKRKAYDQFGEAGVNGMGGGGFEGFSPEDIFSQVFGQGFGGGKGGFDFGGFGGREEKRTPTRSDDLHYEYEMSLEDFYNGTTKTIEYPRDEICSTCNGRGTNKLGVDKTCKTCKGTGQVKATQRFGGGLFTQVSPCGACNGSGEKIKAEDSCKSCQASGVQRKKKTISFKVEPGMKSGSDILFRGESHQYPGIAAGDVIISLTEKPHYLLTRYEDDLYMKKQIPLIDALTGYDFNFKHLDGRTIKIKNNAKANVVSPNDVIVIHGEGMPGRGKRGNLYVQLNVAFPKGHLLSEKTMLNELGTKSKSEPASTTVEAIHTNHPFISETQAQEIHQKGRRKKSSSRRQQQDQQQCAQM